MKKQELRLSPEREEDIRQDPENISKFDVDCLLHEIDALRARLKSYWQKLEITAAENQALLEQSAQWEASALEGQQRERQLHKQLDEAKASLAKLQKGKHG